MSHFGGLYRINGDPYPRSRMSNARMSGTWFEYDLRRDFELLEADIGLSDASTTGSAAYVEILNADSPGTPLWEGEVVRGDVFPIQLSVANLSRIRFRSTGIAPGAEVVFGDLRVIGFPGTASDLSQD